MPRLAPKPAMLDPDAAGAASDPPITTRPKAKRGFAVMSVEQRKRIAAMGGRAVPAESRSFSNPELAASAGRKGGKATPAKKRSFSVNPELAKEAGRKGAAGLRRRKKEPADDA